MTHAVTTDALLLRAVDYRDADRIVTLYTQAQGKVGALARGAKSSRRRFQGALEPYAILRVELSPGRGELHALRGASVTRSFLGILSDLQRMQVAGAALALVRETNAPNVADHAVFLSVVQYLTLVDLEGDVGRERLLGLAMRLLSLAGLAPRLDTCGRSGEPVPEGRAAYFDPGLGAVVSRRAGGGPFLLPGEARMRLIEAQRASWLAAAQRPWDEALLSPARAALAAFLAVHVSEDVGALLFPD